MWRRAADAQAGRELRQGHAYARGLPLPAGAAGRTGPDPRLSYRRQRTRRPAEPGPARNHLHLPAAPGVVSRLCPVDRRGAAGVRRLRPADERCRGGCGKSPGRARVRRGGAAPAPQLGRGVAPLPRAGGCAGRAGDGERRGRLQQPAQARCGGVPGLRPGRRPGAAGVHQRRGHQGGADVHARSRIGPYLARQVGAVRRRPGRRADLRAIARGRNLVQPRGRRAPGPARHPADRVSERGRAVGRGPPPGPAVQGQHVGDPAPDPRCRRPHARRALGRLPAGAGTAAGIHEGERRRLLPDAGGKGRKAFRPRPRDEHAGRPDALPGCVSHARVLEALDVPGAWAKCDWIRIPSPAPAPTSPTAAAQRRPAGRPHSRGRYRSG
jgi:hypothetical protein